MQVIKKTMNLSIAFMMSTTLVFAEQTRTRVAGSEYEQMLEVVEQLSEQDLKELQNNNAQIAMVDAALSDQDITSMPYAQFKTKMLQGLGKSQEQQARIAGRIISPRGLFEGRREARHQRRVNRFISRVEARFGESLDYEHAMEALRDRMDETVQAEERQALASELDNHDNAISFLNAVKQDLLAERVAKNDTTKIGRKIAGIVNPCGVGQVAVYALPALIPGLGLILGSVAVGFPVATALLIPGMLLVILFVWAIASAPSRLHLRQCQWQR